MRNKVAAATAIALAFVLVRRHRQQAATTHRRDLAHVKFEVHLLEKQLELARLEADASRARHERDLRQAAVDAAQELSSAAAVPVAPAPPPPRPPVAPAPVAPAPAAPATPPRRPPPATGPLTYLRDPTSNAPRRRITVVVYNKIRGYLDWLRPDFVNDARTKCSTECVFTDRRTAHDGLLFHAKTHSARDFPRGQKKSKYLLVSLEQEKYAPLLRNPNYVKRFDYVMTRVEIKILRRVHAIDAALARWRGDAGSSPLDRARSAASSPRNDLVKNCRVHPTHWLISTQLITIRRRSA